MTEAQESALPSATNRRHGVIDKVARFLVPTVHPERVIYGTLTVAVLLAASTTPDESHFLREFVATFVVLVLYWIAHSYAAHLGSRLDTSGNITHESLKDALIAESSILRGALFPLGLMLVARLFGASPATAELVGLWTAIILLIVFEVAAGLREHLTMMGLLRRAGLGMLFALGIIGLKVLVH